MTKRRERETDDAVPSKALSVLGPVPMLGNENVWVLVTVEPRTAACIADEEDSRRGEVDAAGAAGEVGKASRAEDTLEPDVSGIAEVVALNAVEDSGLHRLRPRRAFTNYFPEEAWFHSPSSPRKRRSSVRNLLIDYDADLVTWPQRTKPGTKLGGSRSPAGTGRTGAIAVPRELRSVPMEELKAMFANAKADTSYRAHHADNNDAQSAQIDETMGSAVKEMSLDPEDEARRSIESEQERRPRAHLKRQSKSEFPPGTVSKRARNLDDNISHFSQDLQQPIVPGSKLLVRPRS